MKFNKITTIAAMSALALVACDDDKMDSWGSASGDVDASEIPVELAEAISRYDAIKSYITSGERGLSEDFQVGVGIGATIYTDADSPMKDIVDENFNIITFGNAMKMQSVMGTTGKYDFSTIDETVAAMPADLLIYGHNFLWHTQQQSTHLYNLIKPSQVIEDNSSDVCENVITGYDFETEDDLTSSSWTAFTWAKLSDYGVTSPGYNDSEGCAYFTISDESSSNWDCQLFWTLDDYLEEGVTYAYEFYAKTTCSAGQVVQFLTQNASYSGWYGDDYTVDTDWGYFTGSFTYEGTPSEANKVGIQFGGSDYIGETLYIDDFKFGVAVEDNSVCENVITSYDLETEEDLTSSSWTAYSWAKLSDYGVTSPGYNDSDGCAYFTISDESSSNWDCQLFWTLDDYLEEGETYAYEFYAKSTCSAGHVVQFLTQNASYSGWYGDDYTVDTDWGYFTGSFTYEGTPSDANKVGIQFGGSDYIGETLYIDNFKFGVAKETTTDEDEKSLNLKASVTYTLKTDDEKYALLDSVMEAWIMQMAYHMDTVAPGRVVAWDVVNEPITDGGNWRGLDNNYFMSDDDYTDEAWYEDETSGLTINWQDGHWYWAAFMGKDYAVNAFKYARQYAPNAKLFVNDYNLETSSTKLAALIEFVEYVESQGAEVDGIGTQMHISTDTDSAGIVEMFQTLATTGKLIRITELDITNGGGSSPTSDQLEAQSDMYQFVLDAYFQYIPTAQQYGVCVWSLSDNEAEHEYWLEGETPNLYDTDYERKHAYMGFCDGLAGYVVSDTFTSTVYTESDGTSTDDSTSEE